MVEWGNYAEAYKAIHDKLNEILSKLDKPSDPTVQDIIDRAARQLGIISPSGDMARKAYYDRNASVIIIISGGNYGQHLGWTQRWSYTVPTDKKYMNALWQAGIETTMTTGKVAKTRIKVNGNRIMMCVKDDQEGYWTQELHTLSLMLVEGDSAACDTYSNDGAKTHYMSSGMLGVEFDE
ncbi:MAG: hypothetical protein JSV12_06125 [Candidatus Bathyarchaeota archaeon]|nr:MAG: hypothetical protein JSV12_06125 [Candidatus Bathyarchaeota archaeon]